MPSREYTRRLLEAVENGLTTWETVATSCLDFMSEQEVQDMCEVYFPEVCPDEVEVDDEEEDNEWYDDSYSSIPVRFTELPDCRDE
jgi:hypothetical protein